MPEQKTRPNDHSVAAFLKTLTDENRLADCGALIGLMQRITGEPPMMWGPSIIGFGKYHYRYESGHEGDICITGFSPRKQNLSLYVLAGFPGQESLLAKLGKHRAGKGCLFVKRLKDIDPAVLEALISRSVIYLREKYPS